MKITPEMIILDTDPIIRTKSEKVTIPLSEEDKELLDAMITYVRRSQDDEIAEAEHLRPAVGIAAIQLGIPKQLIAVSVPTENGSDEFALANPKIVSESVQNAYLAQGEGCLSVAQEHEGYVYRHARITVTGYDLLRNEMIRVRASGYTAICLQHEIDHLSGTLFYDRIHKDDPWKEDPEAVVIALGKGRPGERDRESRCHRIKQRNLSLFFLFCGDCFCQSGQNYV